VERQGIVSARSDLARIREIALEHGRDLRCETLVCDGECDLEVPPEGTVVEVLGADRGKTLVHHQRLVMQESACAAVDVDSGVVQLLEQGKGCRKRSRSSGQ
jgi:hypothetical protein